MLKRLVLMFTVLAVVTAAACGNDDDANTVTDADGATTTTAAADGDDGDGDVVTGPASIAASDQTGDGSTVTVDSVTLPTGGFVVIHADADGSPGPILGWSDLLPEGESTDVVVTLNEPLTASATVWPMAHVDADGDGEYEFMPPDVTVDIPATTAEGDVAVLPIMVTVS